MSSFFKKYFIAFIAFCMVLGLIWFNPFHSKEKDSSQNLVVGLQSGYPPFEFRDAQGNIIGFDAELAGLIANKLGKKLVINDMEFDGIILSLKQGKIDLIMSGMNITPSRLKEIHMVPYLGEAAKSLSLIFWKKIPLEIHSLEDIAKFSNPVVSVQSGAIPETYLVHYPNIHTKSFQDPLQALMDVKFGKSLANLVEPDVAAYFQKQHPEVQILSVPLHNDENIMGFGIGIKKENQSLHQQVEKIVHELAASGQLKQLEDKWFKGAE